MANKKYKRSAADVDADGKKVLFVRKDDNTVTELAAETDGRLKVSVSGTGTGSTEMQGTAADGTAAVGKPVQVGGKDDSNNIQTIRTDTAGDVQVDLASAIPAGNNNIGDVDIATVPVVGAHANAWNNVSTGAGGFSAAIDVQYAPFVSVFGNTGGASTITVQLSQNNTDFYDSDQSVAANGNFGKLFTVGARYVRLKSSADVTATATIAAKG